jgi:hypothetical protein
MKSRTPSPTKLTLEMALSFSGSSEVWVFISDLTTNKSRFNGHPWLPGPQHGAWQRWPHPTGPRPHPQTPPLRLGKPISSRAVPVAKALEVAKASEVPRSPKKWCRITTPIQEEGGTSLHPY